MRVDAKGKEVAKYVGEVVNLGLGHVEVRLGGLEHVVSAIERLAVPEGAGGDREVTGRV